MPLKRGSFCNCGRERAFSALAQSKALAPSISSIQTYGSSSFAADSRVVAHRMPMRRRSFTWPSLRWWLVGRRATAGPAATRRAEVCRHRFALELLIGNIDVDERARLRRAAIFKARQQLFLHEQGKLLVLLELGQRLFRR